MNGIPVVLMLSVVGMVISAAILDVHSRKIPNALILGFLFPALLVGSLIFGCDWFSHAVLKGGIVLSFLFPVFFIRALGAGDIKLLAAISAIVGQEEFIAIMIVSLIAGAILGLLIFSIRYVELRRSTIVYSSIDLRQPGALKIGDTPTVPYGVAIASATLWVFYSLGYFEGVLGFLSQTEWLP